MPVAMAEHGATRASLLAALEQWMGRAWPRTLHSLAFHATDHDQDGCMLGLCMPPSAHALHMIPSWAHRSPGGMSAGLSIGTMPTTSSAARTPPHPYKLSFPVRIPRHPVGNDGWAQQLGFVAGARFGACPNIPERLGCWVPQASDTDANRRS